MSINLKDVQKKLNELKQKESYSSNSDLYWKPEEGDNIIRIVPYQHNTEWPFIEIYTHYNFSKLIKEKGFLTSPKTLGEPDPLIEWAEKLKQTGEKSDYALAKKFEPSLRIHVPIIVRGKEDEGVKFYGFGVKIYEDLLSIMNDSDYGDITSLKDGRDVVINYTPKDKSSTEFAESKLRVKPNQTPAVTTKEQVELLKNQTNLTSVLKILSYDELKQKLANFLNPEDTETIDNSDFDEKTSVNNSSNVDGPFSTNDVDLSYEEKDTSKTNSEVKSKHTDITSQLDDLFKQ